MRELLGRYGFAVVRDQDLPEISAALSLDLARKVRAMSHIRITVADRDRAGAIPRHYRPG
jgi:hypothetical protein